MALHLGHGAVPRTIRLAEADQAIQEALTQLTRAICLVGLSENKAAVQVAHATVAAARIAVQAAADRAEAA